MISTVAEAPEQVVELGAPALFAQAAIAGNAVATAVSGSVREMEGGNLTGAWRATEEAWTQAEEQSLAVQQSVSLSGAKSMGVLVVFLLTVGFWLLELFLTRRGIDAKSAIAKATSDSEGQNHYLSGLGFMRFWMAWHVVLYNFYPQAGTPYVLSMFCQWGEIGVPWFFLVSGFVNTYQMLVRRPSTGDVQEDWFWGMFRRVAKWYPFFVIAVVWCSIRSFSTSADDWNHFLANMLLIHGIFFDADTSSTNFPYLLGNWWLSFLMAYLLAFTPLHEALKSSTTSRTVISTVFYIGTLIAIPSAILEWYFMQETAWYKLIQYWPSFVFGQALGHWFVHNCMQLAQRGEAEMTRLVYVMRPVHEIPKQVRFGATLGFMILGFLYFCFPPHARLPLLHRPVAPLLLKGGLLPVIGLQVAGFASEVDPLAKLFARVPFCYGEKLAFMTFIFQVPVHNCIVDWTGWTGMSWSFTALLFGVSVLGHYCLERPWRRTLTARIKT
jgi:peptidoglycan/LPS O-acetylase OafA/YrhL